MSVGLLLPAALAALAALALPLLIHLSRRSERPLLVFAAVRWLRAKQRARRRVRIEEWLLLVLRLLLLAAVVVLLAQPVWFGAGNDRAWVVVVPGADPAALADDPTLRAAHWHWLMPGFPAFASTAPQSPTATASLLRELDATLAASQPLTLIVPEHLDGLDAERIVLSRRVDWRIVTSRAPRVAVQSAAPAPQQVTIRHDAAHAALSRYFNAAANAWNAASEAPGDDPVQQPFVIDSATTDGALPTVSGWLLWLSADALPASVERWLGEGGSVLRIADSASAADDRAPEIWRGVRADTRISAQRSGRGRLLILHGVRDPADLPETLEPEFPTLLRDWLSALARGPDQALAQHVAPVTGIAAWPPASTPLDGILIALIAVLWLSERVLASARRKASQA